MDPARSASQWCGLVEGDLEVVSRGQRLASEDVAIGLVVGIEPFGRGHGYFALVDMNGAGPHQLPAGMGRLDSVLEQHLDEILLAWPGEPVRLAVEFNLDVRSILSPGVSVPETGGSGSKGSLVRERYSSR